jgi:hypothetical protein
MEGRQASRRQVSMTNFKPRKGCAMSNALRALLLLTAVSSFGCYVREVRGPPPGCPYGAVWVEGFRDPYGGWHHGHWQCR